MTRTASFDSREFRGALGAFTTGVTIVTARDADGVAVGVTANSFNSVSLDPPMILWSLAKNARSLAAFEQAQHWVVHILAADQDALSNSFARSGEDKFAGLETEQGAGDAPMLTGCSARLQCKTAFRYEGGDHVILVGEVIAFDRCDTPSLVFHGGKYALATVKTDPTVLSGSGPRESDISTGEDFLGYLLWRAHLHFRNLVNTHLQAQDLDVDSFMILAMLLHRNGRSHEQLASALLESGRAGMVERVVALQRRGFVILDSGSETPIVWLTDAGREATLLIHAASKALETDLIERMEGSEGLAFKHLLRRFIVKTDQGLPHPWENAERAP